MTAENPRAKRLRFALAACLLVLGLAYLSVGMLAVVRGKANDIKLRWQETQYVLQGVNPNAVLLSNLEESKDHIFIDDPSRLDEIEHGFEPGEVPIDPEIGVIRGGSYPPWCHLTLSTYCAWPLPVATIIYTLLVGVSLCYVVWWVWSTLRRRGVPADWAALALCTVLAFSAFGGALRWGNLPIIVFALVLAATRASDRGMWLRAGLLLGLSFVKPTVALPFVGLFVVKGRWGTLGVAGAYTALAMAFLWVKIGTPPHVFMGQCSALNLAITMNKGVGVVQWLMAIGVDRELAYKGVLLGTVLVTALVLLAIRRKHSLYLLAVCALAARLWTYHHYFDNLIFTALFVALFVCAWRTRSRACGVAAIALAASMIPPNTIPGAPASFNERYMEGLFAVGHAVWVITTAILLMAALRSPDVVDGDGDDRPAPDDSPPTLPDTPPLQSGNAHA